MAVGDASECLPLAVAELSRNQLCQLLSTCHRNDLDGVLQEVQRNFPGLCNRVLARVLFGQRGMRLRVAVELMQSVGFTVTLRNMENFASVISEGNFDCRLDLFDLELALGSVLGGLPLNSFSQEWFGHQFIAFWRSPGGVGLNADILERFRSLWETVRPTVPHRVPPDHACSLQLYPQDMANLLSVYVDTNGDCTNIVRELLLRGELTPELVNKHQGFIRALVDVNPTWVARRVLTGEVVLVEPQPSVALRLVSNAVSLLRALAAEVEGPPRLPLTKQNVAHLSKLVLSLRHVRRASDMMWHALPPLLLLLRRVRARSRRALLTAVSSFCLLEEDSDEEYFGVDDHHEDDERGDADTEEEEDDEDADEADRHLARWKGRRGIGRGTVAEAAPRESQLATVAHPRRGESDKLYSTTSVKVFDKFVEIAVDFVSLNECVSFVRQCTDRPASPRVRSKFFDWSMSQLDSPQDSHQMLQFLKRWVLVVCSLPQILEIWRKMVQTLNSWSFLRASWAALRSMMPDAVYGDYNETDMAKFEANVYSFVSERLALEPRMCAERRRAIMQQLAAYAPTRFVQDHGVCALLDVQRSTSTVWSKTHPSSYRGEGGRWLLGTGEEDCLWDEYDIELTGTLTSRTSHAPSVWAEQVNDALLPEKELGTVMAKHPKMEVAKTKEDWIKVSDWVAHLDWHVFCAPDLAARMSQVLSAVWSDRNALTILCGEFFLKMMKCVQVTHDCAPLVKFVCQCPNIGNKQNFLATRFKMFAEQGKDQYHRHIQIKLSDFHPLIASQATTVHHFVTLVHALGCETVFGDTAKLFYRLLHKDAPTPYDKMLVLKICQFGTRTSCNQESGEDEEWDWTVIESASDAPASPFVRPDDVADDVAGDVDNRVAPVSMVPACGVFKKFGPEGERVALDFLPRAQPHQLVQLFAAEQGGSEFRALCHAAAVQHWGADVKLDVERDSEKAQDSTRSAEHFGYLVDVVTSMFPQAYCRVAPRVWEATRSIPLVAGESAHEEHVKRLLTGRVPQLDMIPQRWWHCADWRMVKEQDLVRMVCAGVAVSPANLAWETLGWGTQQAILQADLVWNNIGLLVDYAPLVIGGIAGCQIVVYLERIFNLLGDANVAKQTLVQLGDGLNQEEQQASGWNKLVHRLLACLRRRVQADNMLTSREQVLLFQGCVGRADNSNSALLADMMESKNVDPVHVAPLVKYVLGTRGFNKQVRDSALRAMMRLEPSDRNTLHSHLLDTDAKLPLQVLFSLAVTSLHATVIPLVLKQLNLLSPEEWIELIGLIKDANPMHGPVHTFPRSLGNLFHERMLVQYLSDKNRDLRLFHLFATCSPPEAVPGYLLDILARQLHELDDTLLGALSRSPLQGHQFRNVIEYIPPAKWTVHLDWMLARVRESSNPSDLFASIHDLLGHKTFCAFTKCQLYSLILHSAHMGLDGKLLKIPNIRSSIWRSLHAYVPSNDRSLWITFFKESWILGEPPTQHDRESELKEALDKHQKGLREIGLTHQEVQELGVDTVARKLLISMAPNLAIPRYGVDILKIDPNFASDCSDEDFELLVKQIKGMDDTQWPLLRQLIKVVQPDRGLVLSIKLLKNSCEEQDVQILKSTYHAADSFTRKQTCLMTQLGCNVWKKFRVTIQDTVIDAVVCNSDMSPAISGFVVPVKKKQDERASYREIDSDWQQVC